MKLPFLRKRVEGGSSRKSGEEFVPTAAEQALIESCSVPGTPMPDLGSILEEARIPKDRILLLREEIISRRYSNVVKGGRERLAG